MRYFIIIALIVYVLPNLLIFIRFIRLIRNRKARTAAGLVFLFILCAFPVGELLNNTIPSDFSGFYLQLGYYYLPFLLYFILISIACHLAVIMAQWLHIISKAVMAGRSFRLAANAIMLFISMGIVILGHVNFNDPHISQYKVEVPAGSGSSGRLKMVMAADLHIYELTSRKFMDRFVDRINQLEPDVVLLPGDILEGPGNAPELNWYAEKLSTITSTHGVYTSSGNHEHYGRPADASGFFDRAGIVMLDDTVILIGRSFQLAGLADDSRHNERIKQNLSRAIADTLPSVLLHHRPENFEFAGMAGADIMLSGHTHHGQLWPLNLITNAVYEITRGYKKINGVHVFVTTGAQGWGPPVRTGSHSEIMLIDVEFISQ